MNRFTMTALLAGLALMGCKDKDDDTGGTTTPGDGGTADGGTADGGTADGGTGDGGTGDGGTEGIDYTLSGTALDLAAGIPAMAGMCVSALNPDGAVTGGKTVSMSDSTLGDNGAFTLAGVDAKPAFGILISVYDCDGDPSTAMTTATPVLPASYADIENGGELSGLTAFSINNTYVAGIDGSLTAAGYSGSLSVDGGLMGGVWDSSLAPIDGATVTGGTAYYQDDDPGDGLFTTGTSVNDSTIAAASSLFVIPAAGIAGYSAKAAGYTFPTNTLGSNPGSIVFAPIIAE